MRRGAEPVGPGCVHKPAQHDLHAYLPPAVRRKLDLLLGLLHALLEVAVQRHAQATFERVRPLVGKVDVDSGEPLVGGPDRHGRENTAEVV